MRLSQAGIDLIVDAEGEVLHAYDDGGRPGVGNCTIGVGHLLHLGPCTPGDIQRWKNLSHAGAMALLQQDATKFEAGVAHLVKVPLTPNQHAALVSLAFNIGLGAFGGSTLLRVLNQGQYREAADQFLRWDKDDNRVLPGLTKRRKAERKLFLKGIDAAKVKRWEARLATVRTQAKRGGWSLTRRVYARVLKKLIERNR